MCSEQGVWGASSCPSLAGRRRRVEAPIHATRPVTRADGIAVCGAVCGQPQDSGSSSISRFLIARSIPPSKSSLTWSGDTSTMTSADLSPARSRMSAAAR